MGLLHYYILSANLHNGVLQKFAYCFVWVYFTYPECTLLTLWVCINWYPMPMQY